MNSTSYPYILVVDDDEDDRYMIDYSFREIQWESNIKLLTSGKGLFQYLSALTDPCAYPSLILLDYNMPESGAEEIISRLKQHAGYREIQVAVYSTEMSEKLCDRLKTTGAAECYTKSWDTKGNISLADTLRQKALRRPVVYPK